MEPPARCRFAPRCNYRTDKCLSGNPQLINMGNSHYVACTLYNENEQA
ncbi:hypothetical protein [Schnuerera ultunensis]